MDKKTKKSKLNAVSKDQSQMEDQSKVIDAVHKNTHQSPEEPRVEKEVTVAQITAKASVIAALITALGGFLAAVLVVWLPLNAQIDNREEKIKALNAEIARRDTQIQSLTDEVNSLKHPLEEILAQDGKVPFEWQWAGENWYGRVVMEKQAGKDVITQAQVGLLEKNLIDDMSIHGQVLNLVPGTGSISFAEDNEIHLEFVVKKKDRRSGTESTAFVTGDLQQSLCYAGKVNYKHTDTGVQYPGDMILVNYITPLGDPIDYWFSPNKDQPWFERYLIDR